MGGCRCMFRNCNVCSSRYPRMHFFHIPVNDKVRSLKWMEMMGHKEEILRLSVSQQKNRVVCARHFHDEQFVNYLKVRLVSKAVPTLMRLGRTLALNYENVEINGLPQLIELKPPTMEHLIPPPSFTCPLDLDFEIDEKKFAQKLIKEGKALSIKQNQEGSEPIVAWDGIRPKKRSAVDTPSTSRFAVQPSSAVKKVKRITTMSDVAFPIQVIHNSKNVNQLEEMEVITGDNHVQVFQINDIENLDAESLDGFTITAVNNCPETDDKTKIHLQLADEDLLPQQYDDARYEELQRELNNIQNQLQEATAANAALIQSETHLKQKHLILMRDFRQLQINSKSLVKQVQQLERQQQINAQITKTQEDTITTSKECNCSNTEAHSQVTQATLSKAQLFNGIKRYVSASMVPLLRMEMFGSAERQWKPDERRVSVDLLRHGEEIYRYFSDEWRLRLPALRHTREWLANESNSALIDDEEDL